MQRECLGFVLDEGPQLPGVWGGTIARERKQLVNDGQLTGDLIRHWGPHAVEGRRIERFDAYENEKRAAFVAERFGV